MTKPNVIREARAFRVELVLLGMALANDGDREAILHDLGEDVFCSELVAECMKAIRTRDNDDIDRMLAIFKGWGVHVEGRIVDSLIRQARVSKARYDFERACFAVNSASSCEVEAYAAKAEECYQSLKETLGEYRDEGDRN